MSATTTADLEALCRERGWTRVHDRMLKHGLWDHDTRPDWVREGDEACDRAAQWWFDWIFGEPRHPPARSYRSHHLPRLRRLRAASLKADDDN